ncbi:hypothetical protein HWI79_2095 [Cryptosporidium felis]|nr:hypothetical protein HWI79_2095 [Cryptosporidium felis]
MKVGLNLGLVGLLCLLWLVVARSAELDSTEPDIRSLRISNPRIKSSFMFFSRALSNSEKENLLKLSSSSEYARSFIPKGAGFVYSLQMAIYTLSESWYVPNSLFYMYTDEDSKCGKNIIKVVDCLYIASKESLKLLKLTRQRCFFHDENYQLKIFPRAIGEKLKEYCDKFNSTELRFARMADFIYLLKMILRKSSIHNSKILKLSKLVWKIIKSPSFEKIHFDKSLSTLQLTPESPSKVSKKEASLVRKISDLLRHVDNTLIEKVKILPFWIIVTIEEYIAILVETQAIVERIWSPMSSRVASNLRKLKKCNASKKKSCISSSDSKSYKKTGEEKFISKVKEVTKQIRSSIED